MADNNKSKFGSKQNVGINPKGMPSDKYKENKNINLELSYEQMIMGSLASLVWGVTNIKKDDQVRTLLGNRKNIFKLIENIDKNINNVYERINSVINSNKAFNVILQPSSINKLTKSIIDGLQNLDTSNNKNSINTSDININIANLNDLSNLIDKLSDEQSKMNVIHGVSSIIELLTFLNSNSFKLEDTAKTNINALKNVLADNKIYTDLHDIFAKIKKIIDNNIDADIRSLSLIIDNVIKIISIDPKTINLKGLRYLVRVTDPDHGLIAKLFEQINQITGTGLKLEQNNFIVLGRFFEALVMLADIGFIKRRRIRDNVSFIKKHIIGMIPDIIKELNKVVDDNQKDAYTAIGNLSAVFNALSELSELNMRKKFRLMLNLEFIKDIYIHQIVDILKEIQNASKDSASAAMTLTAINDVIKTVLTLGDISLIKIGMISLKSELLTSVIENEVYSILKSIIKIENIKDALSVLGDIEDLFGTISSIYTSIPGLRQTIHEALKLSYISHIIDTISVLIANINDAPKFTRQQALNETWPKLFTAIYTLLDDKELSKIKETNDSLIYINDTLLPNIFSIILSVNSMPNLKNSRAWKNVLKTILEEFDDTDDNSLSNMLAYKLNKGILEDVTYLNNILMSLSNVVNEVNSIKKIDEDKIQGLLTVTKTIVEQFNEDNKDSIASNFTNINDKDLEKVDTIVKLLEKLSKLNKVKFVLNISEGTIKTISLIGKPIKEFVETLGSISEDDLKKANELINAFYKITIGGALILVGIGLLIKFIKVDALASFILILGGFLLGLTGILRLLSKSLKDSMKYAKDAMIFVGACAAILLFGALVNKYIKFEDLFGFLFKVGTFMLGVAGILFILSLLFNGKLMNKGFKSLASMTLLIALVSVVMILASTVNEYIEWDSLWGFLGKFALYIVIVGGICALLGLTKKYLVVGALALLGIMVLTVLAIGVMQLMYLQAKQENYYDTIVEGLEAMAWVFGSFVAVIAGLGALVGYTYGVGAVVLIAGMATLVAIEEVIKEAAKAMTMIYIALSNFKNLNLSEQDFDRMADMIKGFAMLSVLLVDKIPLRKLAKLAVASKVIHKTAVAIGAIAKALKEFATLRIPTGIDADGKATGYVTVANSDFSTAQENIAKLITCVMNGVLDVAKTHPALFEDHLFTDSPAMNAAKVAHKMGQALGSIAKGISEFASSKMAIEFDDNGKPTKYIRITAPIMRAAAASIKNVLVCIGSALTSTVKDNPELFKEGVIADSPAMNAAKTLKIMGDVIANAASAIGALASEKVPIYDKDGKLTDPSNWLTFKLSDMEKDGPVYNAVNSILTCLGNSLKAVVDNEENKWMFDDGAFSKSPAAEAATAMKNMGDALNSTIDAITKISEIKTDDLSSKIDTMQENIKSAIISVLRIFKLFTNTAFVDKNGKSLIKQEAIKSGVKGFVNDLSTFFGGSGEVYKTNGSIAQYINDNIGEIEKAGDAIQNITSVISSIISSLSKVGKSNANLAKYKGLLDDSSDMNLTNVFSKIITQIVGIYKSITIGVGNVDINSQIKKTEELNELIDLYITNLNSVVKLSKFASEIGEEGYNILRDGILSIYSATSQIGNGLDFYFHVQQLKAYIESINSIKLDNLNSLKGFVDSLNELSARLGNLDKLTDAISNKLSEVLYELVLQLRKAEATITNAHELQEKRKKLMEESIGKIETIMNQHMIVEISQAKDKEPQQPQGNKINNINVSDGAPTSADTTPDTSTPKMNNPEATTAATGVKNDKSYNLPDFTQYKDVLTYQQFKNYMEKEFVDRFRNAS